MGAIGGGGEIIFCSQVAGSHAADNEEADAASRKRPIADVDVILPFDEVSKRQRAWLRRDETAEPKTWRPTKLHRVSTKWWLLQIDNQIRQCTHFSGLAHFQIRDDWGHWSKWPHCSLSIDLGSDGVCAYFAAIYKFKLNMILFPDESHSCKNSFIECAKESGVWHLLLLMLITWNLEFGPRQEETRRSDLRAASENCYEYRRPS